MHHPSRIRHRAASADGRVALELANALALVAAFGAALAIVVAAGRASPAAIATTSPPTDRAELVDGAVRGADGSAVAASAHRRIVSLVPQAEEALAQLGFAARLAAVSDYTLAHGRSATELRDLKARVPTGASAEAIIALAPDLVLVAAYSDAGLVARLRQAGVAVFDLGAQDGAADAARNLRELAALCGDAATGERAASAFSRRLAHVASPARTRPRACVVLVFAGRLAGGTAGTSYADILAAAGCDDAAAAAGFRGWPTYTVEDLVRIDPQIVVTAAGEAAALAALPGAAAVPALAQRRIVELDGDLLDSPGIAILDAAEALADALPVAPR